MRRVITAVILIPIVVLALFRAPLWLFALLVLGVALLAAKEYFGIAEATGVRPFREFTCVFLVCICLLGYLGGEMIMNLHHPRQFPLLQAIGSIALLLVIFSPFILLAAGMWRDPLSRALSDSAASFLTLPYIGASLASMVLVRSGSNGALFLLVLMLLVWSGDIAAYYVGQAIGKHKLAPRVSPGKTWEGAVASLLGAVLVGILVFHFLQRLYALLAAIHLVDPIRETGLAAAPVPLLTPAPIGVVIALAVCVNVAAQVGDLAESMMKRGGNVKDSGTLLPGHGGVLDRIDALLFAAPVGWVFYFAVVEVYLRFPNS